MLLNISTHPFFQSLTSTRSRILFGPGKFSTRHLLYCTGLNGLLRRLVIPETKTVSLHPIFTNLLRISVLFSLLGCQVALLFV